MTALSITDNLRTAGRSATAHSGGQRWGKHLPPQFTFHGFRYAETWDLSAPAKDAIVAIVMHTDAPFESG